MKTELSQRKVICYNSDFDTQILNGDCQRHGLPPLFAGWGEEGVVPSRAVVDAMRYYAGYVGTRSAYHQSFCWPSLPGAGHTALADCYAVLELITMLIVNRRVNEAIALNGVIRIVILLTEPHKVKIGIAAPPDVIILREELL